MRFIAGAWTADTEYANKIDFSNENERRRVNCRVMQMHHTAFSISQKILLGITPPCLETGGG